ncbi:MAG: hypothetical protein FD157_3537 [Rhodocyclaceae bacterium]|nr:MAG: hypothetical protein FD157_3537 [Rhodocyclaceae bacterium]TND01850.1 MAG: hypothetical protein FD118_2109 [Rhodocyclaceae bacterium]
MMRFVLLPFLLAILLGAGSALAQVPDPTRPAGVLVVPEAGGSVAGPLESGVQTVILRPGGKSAAVINGQYVEVGGRIGDKKVLKITESEIVLKGESGREVIKVTPAIEKMPTNKAAAIKRRTTGNTE